MAEHLIISVSGMRGIIGENLTASIATEYGCAFGTFLKNKHSGGNEKLSAYVGRDSRPSGQILASAGASGLCAVGIDVVDLGIVTTPGVSVMLRGLACTGGVVITASHNPIPYNGMKLLLDNGVAPPSSQAEQIRRRFFDKSFAFADSVNCGRLTFNDQTDAAHIARVLAIVDEELIVEARDRQAAEEYLGVATKICTEVLG